MGDALLDHAPVCQEEGFQRTVDTLSIKAYIKTMSPEIQEAFLAHVLDGYKVKELAQELGISPSSLENQFRKIKFKLNKLQGILIIKIFL